MQTMVTVAGAGPAGLQTALRLAQYGWDVKVLEDHAEVGQPVNCSGLISSTGIKETGIQTKKIFKDYIYGARIYAPNGTFLEVKRKKPVAYLVDRGKLDQELAKAAEKEGVEIQTESKLMNFRNNSVFYQKGKRGEILKSRVVVGADGAHSKIRELMGLQKGNDYFVHGYQEFVHGNFEPGMAEVHIGTIAPGFFAWVIPHSKKYAELGIGVQVGKKNPKEAMDKFTEKIGLKGNYEVDRVASALIPCGPPLKNVVKDNMMLTGDAAWITKATTGGGIILGMLAGNECAKAIHEHLSQKRSLTNYNTYLKDIHKELNMHWKIQKLMRETPDWKWNDLFKEAKNSGIESFLEEHGHMDRPSAFVGKALKTPRLWKFAPMVLKLL